MDWFLYDNGPCHKRVKRNKRLYVVQISLQGIYFSTRYLFPLNSYGSFPFNFPDALKASTQGLM